MFKKIWNYIKKLFTRKFLTSLLVEILETAYEFGGKDAVVYKIDELVKEGKITYSQGKKIKKVVGKGYCYFINFLKRKIKDD